MIVTISALGSGVTSAPTVKVGRIDWRVPTRASKPASAAGLDSGCDGFGSSFTGPTVKLLSEGRARRIPKTRRGVAITVHSCPVLSQGTDARESFLMIGSIDTSDNMKMSKIPKTLRY